jgi:hypothetical protein
MKRALLGLLAALLLPALACAQTLIPGSLTGGGTVSGPLTLTCGTVTEATPCLNATQTWNAGGVTFTGLKLNATDTASVSASLLMDLQKGGVSSFSVRKDGEVKAALDFWVNNNNTAQGGLYWGASADVFLGRDAANTLALRNGTSAQRLNVYNTYTDASNYELGFLAFSSNNFIIGAGSAGTGTARPIMFQTTGSNRWQVDTSGHFLAVTDNTYDIGASGANRPRNVYVAASVVAGGNVSGGALLTGPVAVASLQTCNAGAKGLREFVTDANATTFLSAVAGGGANNVPVVCDGTSWKIG